MHTNKHSTNAKCMYVTQDIAYNNGLVILWRLLNVGFVWRWQMWARAKENEVLKRFCFNTDFICWCCVIVTARCLFIHFHLKPYSTHTHTRILNHINITLPQPCIWYTHAFGRWLYSLTILLDLLGYRSSHHHHHHSQAYHHKISVSAFAERIFSYFPTFLNVDCFPREWSR